MQEGSRVSLRIPAVSGHFGPGYGMLSMALGLYNEFIVEEVDEGLHITNLGLYGQGIPVSRHNLVFRAANHLFRKLGYTPRGLRIVSQCHIPVRRGLGSSISATLAGLVAANRIARCGLDRGEICRIASELDEPSDRVSACLLGGLVLTLSSDTGPLFMKLPLPRNVEMLLVIPEFEANSLDYRIHAPNRIDLSDALMNMQRCAALVASLYAGESEGLTLALEDRIQMPGARKTIPGLNDVALISRSGNGLGMTICGEGSSMLVFYREDSQTMGRRIRDAYKRYRIKVRMLRVEPDREGTRIEQV